MTSKMLDAALSYRSLEWSLIPLRMNDRKKPAVKWTPYQSQRASDENLREWFGDESAFGVAVIFGGISQNLGSRDFDSLPAYEEWAAAHPDLSSTLPTVQTRRGRHLYFRTDPDDVSSIRKSLGKPHGVGAIECSDGELRIGVGCYSVLPPSSHPSGTSYQWLAPPVDPVPIIELETSGLCDTVDTGGAGQHKTLRDLYPMSTVSTATTVLHGSINEAIQRTLPCEHGQRHKRLFELARELKAIPELADAPVKELRHIVVQWHKLALPYIRTKPFEETWFDFAESWDHVKFAVGCGPISLLFTKAVAEELPSEALRYDQHELRLLVSLCRELQRTSGSEPFFLDCRTSGRLLNVHHSTASRWLSGLCVDEVLLMVERGSRTNRKANQYRYLPAIN